MKERETTGRYNRTIHQQLQPANFLITSFSQIHCKEEGPGVGAGARPHTVTLDTFTIQIKLILFFIYRNEMTDFNQMINYLNNEF